MTENERGYLNGYNAALLSVARNAMTQLSGESKAEFHTEWSIERAGAIESLRELCSDFGDNDWDNELNLSGIIEKHLAKHLHASKLEKVVNPNPPTAKIHFVNSGRLAPKEETVTIMDQQQLNDDESCAVTVTDWAMWDGEKWVPTGTNWAMWDGEKWVPTGTNWAMWDGEKWVPFNGENVVSQSLVEILQVVGEPATMTECADDSHY